MSYSRVALCALALGVARAANEYALNYAKERSAFGEPIAHRQAIAFMIADDFMEIESARLLAWEAAWKLDAGQDAFKEAYLAKPIPTRWWSRPRTMRCRPWAGTAISGSIRWSCGFATVAVFRRLRA